MSTFENLRNRPRVWASAALVTAGLAGGAILGTTMTAGASTSTTSATSSSSSSGSSTNPSAPTGQPPAYHGLTQSGTVTAKGTDSVTIDGTVYAVNSSSDIDKNGEATLSDLAVGDKVTFSTVSGASTPTIDKLHAGDESLDRPSGPPSGAPQGGPAAGTQAPGSQSSPTTGA